MPIKPGRATITIDGNELFINDVKFSYVFQPFDRLEFSAERLRTAPNARGQRAIQIQQLGNTPGQVVIGTIAFNDPIPLIPDVTVTGSNFGNIKKKFNILRYEISGNPSLSANVDAIRTIAANHEQQLQKFDAHIAKASNMETEFQVLKNLQLETFSYLTTTGISASGNSIGSLSDVLITSFSDSVEFEEYISASSVRILKSFSLVLEIRTISDLDVVV